MELYTSEFEELVVKTMLKADHLEHFKTFTDLVYHKLSLSEAFELSQFTFERIRVRWEEPQEDAKEANDDFVK